MQIYMVGGAVRDELLGLPVSDRDHVVVGATPEHLIALGYRPVGRDFPVFLHPRSNEEYALARTERKTAPGYTGFVVHAAADVTLEQDLARRDLTINAMARDEAGRLIDPYHGQRDLQARVLRHVSPAFAEDPVRILRLARFAARFAEFTVAPETLELMRTMVGAGEVDSLVAERVWQEIARGLMEARPSRMLEVLRSSGALAKILPEVSCLFGVPQPAQHHPEIDTGRHILLALDAAARYGFPLTVRFAVLMHDLGKGITDAASWPHHHGHERSGVELVAAACKRLKTPADCRDLALLTAREHGVVHRAAELSASSIVKLIERCDGLRRPERFAELLDACACDFNGRHGNAAAHYAPREILLAALGAVREVDAGAIAARTKVTEQIAQRVHQARVEALKARAMQSSPSTG